MDSIKNLLLTGLSVFLFFVIVNPLNAQNIELHGFLQTNFSARTAETRGILTPQGNPLPGYLLGDERVQLQISKSSTNVRLLSKTDFFYDAVSKKMNLDIREAYIDLTLGKFDIRTGRQIITWGLGDLVFINDVFPKDWVAFASSQPLEYLKAGADAININFFPGFTSFQLVVIPFYQSDVLPTGERITVYDPFPDIAYRQEIQPELSIGNTQIAGRLYRYVGNFDISLYYYRGFWGSPPGFITTPNRDSLTITHPGLNLYGTSVQGPLLNGVLSFESGYLNSRDDAEGTSPGIENSQVRYLLGYQRPFGENFSINLQYYGEYIQNYKKMVGSLPVPTNREELRHTLSLRLTQYFSYQTLRLSFFAYYSPNERDYYFNPEFRYDFGSDIYLNVGGTYFGGKKDDTFLGQFDKNDNIYFVLRYAF
jgi:hypothetical protein